MRVLVTAFKKFGNALNNFSEEVIKYINNVDKIILDVVYDECYKELISLFNLEEYDLIIALGEARMRSELMLEVQAVNMSCCSMPDNNGVLKKDCVISLGGEEILKTKIDVEKCKEDIIFSFNAGKFVCNNLYYHLLLNYPEKSIFIHIPNCFDLEENYKKYGKDIERIISRII